MHSTDFLKRVLITADDALKSSLYIKFTEMELSEVLRKFEVAADLLYQFVKDFPTLNPNIRNVRSTAPRIFDRKSMGASKILDHLEKSIDPNVEFSYDSSSLNADES